MPEPEEPSPDEQTAKLNARLKRQMRQLKLRMSEERRKLEDRSFDPPNPSSSGPVPRIQNRGDAG